MIIDTSALVAILRDEPKRTSFAEAIEPVTAREAIIARSAYRHYGRGSGHPAKLNFGDCLSYALAVDTGEALLFKGTDFIHSDIRPAL